MAKYNDIGGVFFDIWRYKVEKTPKVIEGRNPFLRPCYLLCIDHYFRLDTTCSECKEKATCCIYCEKCKKCAERVCRDCKK